jgi:hypothetical protein
MQNGRKDENKGRYGKQENKLDTYFFILLLWEIQGKEQLSENVNRKI